MTNQEGIHQPTLPKVEVAVVSEQGRRDENQDWLSWTQTPRGELFVIADGMGGYKGGALAAKMTVEMVERAVSDAPQEWSFGKAVTEALSLANGEVHRLAHSGNPDTENMGSTALVMLLSDGRAQIAHVGDSRAYLLRDDRLQLLTRDHTRVQQMIDAKMLTLEQARNHPEGHLLSRAIGSHGEVEVEISGPVTLKRGDALLLCSDGLSGFVTDEQICNTLKNQRDVQRVPEELVNLALSAGGNDNITIQFVRVDGTVRERVTAQMPVVTVLAQGRPRDAFAMLAKRGVVVFVGMAAVAVLATNMPRALAPPMIELTYDRAAGVLRWNAEQAESVDIQPNIGVRGTTGQAVPKPTDKEVMYTATATARRLFVWPVTAKVTATVPATLQAVTRSGTSTSPTSSASTGEPTDSNPAVPVTQEPAVAQPSAAPSQAAAPQRGGASGRRGQTSSSRPASGNGSNGRSDTSTPPRRGGASSPQAPSSSIEVTAPAPAPSEKQDEPPKEAAPANHEPTAAKEPAPTSTSQRPEADADAPGAGEKPVSSTPSSQTDERGK